MTNVSHGFSDVTGHVPSCACGLAGERSEKYDAYYCPDNLMWLEAPCGDADCGFCRGRPDHADGVAVPGPS